MNLIFGVGLGVHTTDLPQGNKQANIKRHNALRGCRFCYVGAGDWSNLNIDTVATSRYEQYTANQLEILYSLPEFEQEQFSHNHGLSTRKTQPFKALIFDRHRQIPIDPAHCICQGLDAVLIEATISILSTGGKEHFMALLDSLALPHGWSRFQNPITHIRSYFFSDLARLIMVGPIIIHQLKEKDFSTRALKCMRLEMGLRSKIQVLDEVLLCWIVLASASIRIFAAEVDSYSMLEIAITNLARQLVKVYNSFYFLLLSHF